MPDTEGIKVNGGDRHADRIDLEEEQRTRFEQMIDNYATRSGKSKLRALAFFINEAGTLNMKYQEDEAHQSKKELQPT